MTVSLPVSALTPSPPAAFAVSPSLITAGWHTQAWMEAAAGNWSGCLVFCKWKKYRKRRRLLLPKGNNTADPLLSARWSVQDKRAQVTNLPAEEKMRLHRRRRAKSWLWPWPWLRPDCATGAPWRREAEWHGWLSEWKHGGSFWINVEVRSYRSFSWQEEAPWSKLLKCVWVKTVKSSFLVRKFSQCTIYQSWNLSVDSLTTLLIVVNREWMTCLCRSFNYVTFLIRL